VAGADARHVRADSERDRVYIDPIHASLNLFRKEDGRLLFGTDVGYLPDHNARGELAARGACGLGVDDVLAMLTTHPAAAFGTGTGTVAPGQPGDLVLLDKLASRRSRRKRKNGVNPVIAAGRLKQLPFRIDGAAEP
jgi:imidazolonepropionase-like amidohydrolase